MINHCGSDLHSLITNDVGHHFMYLAIDISSLDDSNSNNNNTKKKKKKPRKYQVLERMWRNKPSNITGGNVK